MKNNKHAITRWIGILPALLALAVSGAAVAQAVPLLPSFSKTFAPDTIGPGSTTTLTFDIVNSTPAGVDQLAFTDTLPAAVTIAEPANALSTCGGTLDAPEGEGTITFSDGGVGALSACSISVDVTSSTPGTHMNESGALTSSAGNSGTATADLIVTTTLPGFTKTFAPDPVPLGSRSTLTFSIDNSLNGSAVPNLDFTDNLPVGMVIADPANAATDCGTAVLPTTVSAVPGASVITLDANGTAGFPAVASGSSCTVTVDVTAAGAGILGNVSEELLANFVSSGKASATLNVTVTEIALIKEFVGDPVPPGQTLDLEFTILNRTRTDTATGLSFQDDLDATLSGLEAVGPPTPNPPCGDLSSLSGTTNIMLAGGEVPPADSCTFTVPVQVPNDATPGAYPNTTTTLSGDFGGEIVTGNAATDDLVVSFAPIFTKEFVDDPVAAGGPVTLRFTITNVNPAANLSAIEFTDDLNTAIPGLAANSLVAASGLEPEPLVDPCGVGSLLTIPDPNDTLPPTFPPLPPDPTMLVFTGGSLAPAGSIGDSCTFDVVLDVPAGTSSGVYTNTTGDIMGSFGVGGPVIGLPASGDLVVFSAPRLTKDFTDDPVQPGGTVTLEFTLEHSPNAPGAATDITFTDDLAAVLTGLSANLPPTPEPPCGPGSSLTGSVGDTLLSFAGGALLPGESCTFSVTLDVPAGATSGTYANTTSDVGATVSGAPATSAPAIADLRVASLTLSKQFIGDPALPGDTLTLRFTVEKADPADDVTGIMFTDSLSAALSGLAAVAPLPTDPCGAGSSIIGTTFLIFASGSLPAGVQSCSFDVTVQVPSGAADGTYVNTTGALTAEIDGAAAVFDAATDDLIVDSNRLSLIKAFTDDPVAPDNPVTLEFTLTNLDAGQAASAVGFSDDLGATLAGLTFDSVLLDTCGGTVAGTGTTMITVSGVSLAASASCTLRVTLTVPAGATANVYTNTTSGVTGTMGGVAVSGAAASDDLEVLQLLAFSKSFDGPTTATGTATLTFTITNPGTANVSGISFLDDLDNVISGLTAINLPALPCGAGSSITGTSLLTFSGGELPPMGGTCSFDVNVLLPDTATAGSYPNTTSELFSAGLSVAPPASADLTVEPPPLFTKSFAPPLIFAGSASTLTFTIDNGASALAASSLDFTDNLPAGVTIATPANATTTCTGGTLTATAGASVIAYTGGSVAASASCTIGVDVTSATLGTFVNTSGELTSSSGTSAAASDTLTVELAPVTSFTGPTATGTGQATASISGGGPGCGFTSAAFVPLSSVPPPPAGLAFPHGLFTYVLEGCTLGATVDISIAYPQPLPVDTELWKFGPTLADLIPHWYTLPSTVAGNLLSFSVTDGGQGDNDLTQDGKLEDPLGPASRALALASAAPIPLIGPWGLVLLAIGLALLAAVRFRGRHASWRA